MVTYAAISFLDQEQVPATAKKLLGMRRKSHIPIEHVQNTNILLPSMKFLPTDGFNEAHRWPQYVMSKGKGESKKRPGTSSYFNWKSLFGFGGIVFRTRDEYNSSSLPVQSRTLIRFITRGSRAAELLHLLTFRVISRDFNTPSYWRWHLSRIKTRHRLRLHASKKYVDETENIYEYNEWLMSLNTYRFGYLRLRYVYNDYDVIPHPKTRQITPLMAFFPSLWWLAWL